MEAAHLDFIIRDSGEGRQRTGRSKHAVPRKRRHGSKAHPARAPKQKPASLHLKCPFAERSPYLYAQDPPWACSASAYEDLSSWRDHVKRTHDPRYNCECGARHQGRDDSVAKFQQKHAECRRKHPPPAPPCGFRPEIMTPAQHERYRKLDWRGKNNVPIHDKVRKVWEALFPDEMLPDNLWKETDRANPPLTPGQPQPPPDTRGNLCDENGATENETTDRPLFMMQVQYFSEGGSYELFPEGQRDHDALRKKYDTIGERDSGYDSIAPEGEESDKYLPMVAGPAPAFNANMPSMNNSMVASTTFDESSMGTGTAFDILPEQDFKQWDWDLELWNEI
ncbi:hypothetical protein SODALDRAFT_3395 [Sodiomyces alkalinus F11]|uniref:Uncharacterized protein n=1 Tax=Sodiomyces alkalinus (strain CBS 110278 / VKM F-3762 / F11) TaxID=1314773 RepID=A0A3N2Q572_SODAK|nr:hypothetical protein SODALDRAFT_3395 [Sodiomyces alkalinus F11]ROT41924.1 hypothetical protein SODALDRAFT_3395 [Sodiomyces alkalinus F11]